jgi:MoaA/NifB/PqqE/SkfB family radical SAM enzyme
VALSLTTICNARCLFCSYPAVHRQAHHYFTLDEIRTWTWPQYIKKMGFGGGIGDPLAHPQFLDIFRYVTAAYPHLTTRVITNGIGLNRDSCEAFAGRLARLRVSLNGATPATWERLMGRRGFEPVCEQVASLSALKSRLNTDKPEIHLIMVINEHNIHEAAAFARLAAQVRAQVVTYHHFIPSLMPQCELPPRASLYYDQERCDQEVERAAQQATALGLLVERPPAFHAACGYFEACRVEHAPEQCFAPWQTCLLAVDEGGRRQMSFCCVGLDTRITYDQSDLTQENFLRLWNHPTLRYFRETVNQGGSNPICGFCRTQDREDPDNLEVYRIQTQVDPL